VLRKKRGAERNGKGGKPVKCNRRESLTSKLETRQKGGFTGTRGGHGVDEKEETEKEVRHLQARRRKRVKENKKVKRLNYPRQPLSLGTLQKGDVSRKVAEGGDRGNRKSQKKKGGNIPHNKKSDAVLH